MAVRCNGGCLPVVASALLALTLCFGSCWGDFTSAELPLPVLLHTAKECPTGQKCVPIGRCIPKSDSETALSEEEEWQKCETVFRSEGVCCELPIHGEQSITRQKRAIVYDHVFENALEQGRAAYSKQLDHIKQHGKVMQARDRVEPAFHRLLQVEPYDAPDETDHNVYEDVFVSQRYADLANIPLEERQQDEFGELPKQLHKRCIPATECGKGPHYRLHNGRCNNLHPERTSWGAAGHPFEKLLPPTYEDGVWAPRAHSVTGSELTSPRTISATLLPDFDAPDRKLNLLLMQFGQFIAHDVSRSISITTPGKQEIECCSEDGSHPLKGDQRHFACMPIEVRPDDPFYSKFGVRCLNFVRLALAREGKCRLGYAKQTSRVTHFIDASTVYGSSEELANSLRTGRQGQLRNSFPVGIEMPPFNRDPSACEPWARVCFEAGDDRSNQILSLVQLHILFLREHNRIARILSEVNHHWDDETLYQEARKIVIAEIQHIVYNEYLPLIIGPSRAHDYGLLDHKHGHSTIYKPNVKPVMLGEVAGAAFRFGHSTVDGIFRIQHRHSPPEILPIHHTFNNPSRVLTPNSFDELVHSLGEQPQQELDHSITLSLTGLLFAGQAPFGSDLASLNIQRGRDIGLRPYNDYRSWAGLPRVRSFHEFGPHGSRLAQVYASPEDIDLWVGGLLESKEGGDGLVGETFGHLLGEQFARLKFGDRYYYTNGPEVNPSALKPDQLAEIQKTSLASIICANVDHWTDFYQAPNAFKKSSHHNVPVPCKSYPDLNFRAWKH